MYHKRQVFFVIAILIGVATQSQSVFSPSTQHGSCLKGSYGMYGYGWKYFQPENRSWVVELGYERITSDGILFAASYHGGFFKKKGIMGIQPRMGYCFKGVAVFVGYLFQSHDADFLKDPNNIDRPVWGVSFTRMRPTGIGFLYASFVRTMARPNREVKGSTFVTMGVKLKFEPHHSRRQ